MATAVALMEEKERMKIERRRKMEQERKERIFQDKIRTMGRDTQALEEQIRSKQEAKNREKEIELEYVRQREEQLKIVESLLAEKEKIKRQQLEETKIWNLGVAARQKRESEIQAQYNTMEPGPSSGQRFAGEDANALERKKMQGRQRTEWIAQQMREAEERKRKERELQRLYEQKMQEFNDQLLELEIQQQKAKAQMLAMDQEFNRSLAEARKEREIQQKLAETFQNLDSVKLQTTGKFLSEDHGPNPTRDNFKGYSPEKLRAIHEEQKLQATLREQQKLQQLEEKRKWESQQQEQIRLINERAAQLEAQRREELKRIQEENRKLAQMQKERQAQNNKQYTTNLPSEDFFAQFNTSSR